MDKTILKYTAFRICDWKACVTNRTVRRLQRRSDNVVIFKIYKSPSNSFKDINIYYAVSSSIGINESKSNTCVFSARVELIHNHRQKDTEILRDAHQQGLRDSGTDTNQNRPFTVLFAWPFPATKSNHCMTSSAPVSRQMLF